VRKREREREREREILFQWESRLCVERVSTSPYLCAYTYMIIHDHVHYNIHIHIHIHIQINTYAQMHTLWWVQRRRESGRSSRCCRKTERKLFRRRQRTGKRTVAVGEDAVSVLVSVSVSVLVKQ